jgi:hypothetical protein
MEIDNPTPAMLDHSKDRADSPDHFSELLSVGSRLLKLALIILTVMGSFATFGAANAHAATYVRISYHGQNYYGYPYRYRGYYHYRGGTYRYRYYRYGRWHYN